MGNGVVKVVAGCSLWVPAGFHVFFWAGPSSTGKEDAGLGVSWMIVQPLPVMRHTIMDDPCLAFHVSCLKSYLDARIVGDQKPWTQMAPAIMAEFQSN
jgi:hypothetical protein